MNEEEAHAVVRLRALESAAPSSTLSPALSPAWSDADAAWADHEARRAEGENASFERWLARRARLATERLATRAPPAGETQRPFDELLRHTARSARVGWAVVLVAFVLGAASDAVGGAARINLLAPPLLAVLAWNLAVYAVLVARWLVHWIVRRRAATALLWPRRGPRRWVQALAGTGRAWAEVAAPLHAARFGAVLHAAAFALALGALLSLYLRGIAFEFRAGWDSTFLTAAHVQTIVATVLGPVAKLAGIALPGVAELEALRFSAGPGENAARWIHLHAITLAIVVLLPRALLAAVEAWRARRLARAFPLPLDDEYFSRLRRRWAARPVVVHVLPYSYTPGPARADALAEVLWRVVAPGAVLALAASVPLGGEDDLATWPDATPVPAGSGHGTGSGHGAGAAVGGTSQVPPDEPLFGALFALTATPERENHGAFVRRLAERAGMRNGELLVLIDESGFRERFQGPDFERRRTERRQAWETMLRDEHQRPVFVDLDDPLRTR